MSMKSIGALLSRLMSPALVLVLLAVHFFVLWALRAKFGLMEPDGSISSNSILFSLAGLNCTNLFIWAKGRTMTRREVAVVVVGSLGVLAVLIVWVAPWIWGYRDVVELERYLAESMWHWMLFSGMTLFYNAAKSDTDLFEL